MVKKSRQPARTAKRPLRGGATHGSNGERGKRPSIHGPRHSRSELESAIQRYVDLYDFAPVAYVSFDRAGRIEEANLATTELLGETRDLLIGRPFAFYVTDLDLFLRHLLHCRTSQQRVETELPLKSRKGEQIQALLCSTPINSTAKDGALLYQTAIMDLRERQAAEVELRASELRYRTLFDLVPVAVYACDANGTVHEYNRRAVELWGQDPCRDGAAARFCGSYKMYYPDGRLMPPEKYPMARALRGEELDPNELEIIVERPDGTRSSVVAAPRLFRDENGKVVGGINCLYDITEHKRAEAAARRLAAVVQSSHDAIVAKDLNGIITDWNKGAERIFGYAPKEVIGKSILILIPKERQNEEQDILSRIRRGQFIDHYETVRRRKDGTLIDVSLTISPVRDAKGKIVGVSKIARDITEKKRVEGRLAEQARLLDLSSDAILVRDTANRIVYWNKGAEKMYGYTHEEAAGKVTHDLLKTEHPEPLPRILEALYRNNRWEGEMIHRRRDGTRITAFSRWSLDRDANGKPVSILETNTDVTERKEIQEALKLAGRLPQENPSPVIRLYQNRIVNFANPAAQKLLAKFGAAVGGKAPPEITRLAADKGRAVEANFLDRVYLVSIAPTSEGNYVNLYFTDITARKKAERALAEAARQQGMLYEFVQRRGQAKSLTDLYTVGLAAILTALRCDRASILFSDEKGIMHFVACHGLSERYRSAVEGYSPWEPDVKQPQTVCIPNAQRADLPKALKRAIKVEGVAAAAFIPLLAGGKLIGQFMTCYNAPHVFSDDELNLASTIARQLAHGVQRKRGDEALRESEERMRAMVEQSTVGMARADLSGRLIFANAPFCRMLGYKESELIGRPVYTFTHPDDANKTLELFGKLVSQAKPFEMEKRYVRKDGSVIWVSVSASPVRDKSGKTQSAVAVAVDITARKNAEAALRRSKELLEKLVRQRTKALRVSNAELQTEIIHRKGLEGELLAVSDREQQRIGQELHDGVCQQLTAIGFLARATALRLKNHRVIEVEDLDKIARLVNKSAMDARAIAHDLHKEEIDAAGFERALRDLAERKVWKTRCRLEIATRLNLEDDKVASELYRILREALINANKHAQATDVVLEACRKRGKLIFSVTDNGVGLNAKSKLRQGLGFHIMKYRAQSIGASVEFESPKGGGTRVTCSLPLPK
jgi:PAS domain S-box-containing protein